MSMPRPASWETQEAIEAAANAAPAWGMSTPQARHDVLKQVGDDLMQRRDEVGELLSREEGKTRAEGVAEVTRAHRFSTSLPARPCD